MTKYNPMRAQVHYLLAAIIIPIYGIQVCPFIDSLEPIQVIIPVSVVLILQYVLRQRLVGSIIEKAALENQTSRSFKMELILFVTSALVLAIYNTIVHGFPLTSGLKVFVGIFGLGFFAAIDISLERERIVGSHIKETGADLSPEKIYFPLSQKVALFATISVVVLIT
ncbi:MAG: hypothetical protein KAQ66_08585, partial [Rhodospirillaceae bacterium]|nr:hypothetical protein [Rhodospirillaceae bacterium]